MNSPEDDKYQHIERIERQLREQEEKLKLRHTERHTPNSGDAPLHQTSKHQPNIAETSWKKKAILGLKLFGLGVAAIVAVRVASFVAGVVIVGLLGFLAYKLFFDLKK